MAGKVVRAMGSFCSLPVGAGALACAIAEQFGTEDLNVLATFVTSLGDCLSLIAAQRVRCESLRENPE